MRTKRNRLTLSERVVIQTLLKQNKSLTYTAKQLSSISREVKKWVIKPTDKYNAEQSYFCAKEEYLNKRNLDKTNTFYKLKVFVYKGLLNDFSPEQIAGSIKDLYRNDPVMSISHEAIYQHIYRHRQSRLGRKLIALLPYNHSSRRHRKYGTKRSRIPDAISIEHRPAHVENRLEIGHCEGDTIVGLGHKSAIATVVERKTRYTFVIYLKDRKSETVTYEIAKYLNNLFPKFRKSMTYDNGMEMTNHKWLTLQTGMEIYFAHPYSPWERGTNENTNGLIRRYFLKKTDFNNVTENRPRKD